MELHVAAVGPLAPVSGIVVPNLNHHSVRDAAVLREVPVDSGYAVGIAVHVGQRLAYRAFAGEEPVRYRFSQKYALRPGELRRVALGELDGEDPEHAGVQHGARQPVAMLFISWLHPVGGRTLPVIVYSELLHFGNRPLELFYERTADDYIVDVGAGRILDELQTENPVAVGVVPVVSPVV